MIIQTNRFSNVYWIVIGSYKHCVCNQRFILENLPRNVLRNNIGTILLEEGHFVYCND